MKLRMGKKLLACLCSVALMAGIGTSLLPASAAAEVPDVPLGQKDLITVNTPMQNAGANLTYENGVVATVSGASNVPAMFEMDGLTAEDTYVFHASIHQTGWGGVPANGEGVQMVFRYTDSQNYYMLEFRNAGTILTKVVNGAHAGYPGEYYGYKLSQGAEELDVTIISAPDKVTVYLNGEAIFTDVALDQAFGAGVGFIRQYSLFTADDLYVYNIEEAAIPENPDIPKLPSADANLIKTDTAFSDPWGGQSGAQYTYENGEVRSTGTGSSPYTFKDVTTGLAASDTFIYSVDLEYSDIETAGAGRPELVFRHKNAVNYMSVFFAAGSAGILNYYSDNGEESGTPGEAQVASGSFSRGDKGNVHIDIVSAPTAVTVYINGEKSMEASNLPELPASVGARVLSSSLILRNIQLFKLPTYTITAKAGENGSISPSDLQTVEFGSDVTYTITPDTDYLVEDVLVDGESVGAVTEYIFEDVQASHTIEATFRSAALPLEITATAGENGSIEPEGLTKVTAGESQTYTITPAVGYEVADVLVDGQSVGAVTEYIFENVVANHTIAASFQLIPSEYTITATPGQHGTIDPSGEVTVERETDKTFTITPDEGFKVADVLVDGESVGAVTEYTFENVVANHTIAVSFSREPGVAVLPEGAVNLITPDTETEGGTYENGVAGVTVPADALEGSLIFTGLDGLTAEDTFVFSTQLYLDAIGKEGWNGPRLYFRRADDNNYLTVIFTPAQVSVYGAIKGEGFGDWGDWRSDKFGCKVGEPIDVIIVSAPDTVSVYVNGQLLIDEAPMPETDEPMAPYIGLLASGGSTSFTATGTAVYKLTEELDVENTITATAGTGGTISPEGASQVFVNAGLTYTITPNGGYEIEDVLVDGQSVGAVGTYTFTNVVEDHTIEATFRKVEQTVPDGTPIKITDLKGEDAGNYFFEDNGFRIPMQMWQHQYYTVTDPEYLPESFYFKARVSFQIIDDSENYHGIRIMFKSKDYENNFQVVWFLDGTFYPVALVNNEYVDHDELGFTKVAPINTDDTYLLEISCEGNDFTFWMDGVQVLDFTVPEEFQDYRTEIGFQQSFVAFRVDDMEMVYGPRPADANTEAPSDGDKDETDSQQPDEVPAETGVALPAAALALGGAALTTAGVTCRARSKRRAWMFRK